MHRPDLIAAWRHESPDPTSRRLRVGVLTFHRCINYGSYWQARCLVEGLRRAGHDAVLLDHRSVRIDRVEWRCALQPLLPQWSSREDRAAYARKTRNFLREIEALPLSAPFPLEQPGRMPVMDAVVIGSDEVWNLAHPWYGGFAPFFGEGLRAAAVVAYAASCGNHDADKGLPDAWAERLGSFRAIAVRDYNSQALVADALGAAPPMVLDPCLQFPPAVAAIAPEGMKPGEFALVYGHNFAPWFADAARRWAAERGLPLVSVGYRNDWADRQWLDAGPREFAGLVAGAGAVFTNFFHGCVFALLNDRPLACAGSPYRMNKVRDLVRALDAGRHLVFDEAGIDAALEGTPGPRVASAVAAARAESTAYLEAALG